MPDPTQARPSSAVLNVASTIEQDLLETPSDSGYSSPIRQKNKTDLPDLPDLTDLPDLQKQLLIKLHKEKLKLDFDSVNPECITDASADLPLSFDNARSSTPHTIDLEPNTVRNRINTPNLCEKQANNQLLNYPIQETDGGVCLRECEENVEEIYSLRNFELESCCNGAQIQTDSLYSLDNTRKRHAEQQGSQMQPAENRCFSRQRERTDVKKWTSVPETLSRQPTVMFIKKYVLIKATLEKSDVLQILGRFFQNGSVTESQYKEINSYLLKERNAKGLDKFLKYIIQREIFQLFLEELDGLEIYDWLTLELCDGQITKYDIDGTEYVLSGKRAEEGQKTRISEAYNFIKLEEELSTLQCDVQTISDHMLTEYSLTLQDHNDIWYCAREQAAGKLIMKIQHAPRLTVCKFDSLLRSVKIDPVPKRIGADAKRIDADGPEMLTLLRPKLRDKHIVDKMEEFGTDLEDIVKGSIILVCRTLADDAVQTILMACEEERIHQFIKTLYQDAQILQVLGEREVYLELNVFIQGDTECSGSKKILFHLTDLASSDKAWSEGSAHFRTSTTVSTDLKSTALEDNKQLLEDELDSFAFLLYLEKQEDHNLQRHPKTVRREIMKIRSRAERVQHICECMLDKYKGYEHVLEYARQESYNYLLENRRTRIYTGLVHFRIHGAAVDMDEHQDKGLLEEKIEVITTEKTRDEKVQTICERRDITSTESCSKPEFVQDSPQSQSCSIRSKTPSVNDRLPCLDAPESLVGIKSSSVISNDNCSGHEPATCQYKEDLVEIRCNAGDADEGLVFYTRRGCQLQYNVSKTLREQTKEASSVPMLLRLWLRPYFTCFGVPSCQNRDCSRTLSRFSFKWLDDVDPDMRSFYFHYKNTRITTACCYQHSGLLRDIFLMLELMKTRSVGAIRMNSEYFKSSASTKCQSWLDFKPKLQTKPLQLEYSQGTNCRKQLNVREDINRIWEFLKRKLNYFSKKMSDK